MHSTDLNPDNPSQAQLRVSMKTTRAQIHAMPSTNAKSCTYLPTASAMLTTASCLQKMHSDCLTMSYYVKALRWACRVTSHLGSTVLNSNPTLLLHKSSAVVNLRAMRQHLQVSLLFVNARGKRESAGSTPAPSWLWIK